MRIEERERKTGRERSLMQWEEKRDREGGEEM